MEDQGFRIGEVQIPGKLVLGPMAGGTDPDISSVMEGAGSRSGLYGNDQCQGHLLQE